jgi:cytochrome c-type biogenesis protein CcmH
MTRTLFTFLCAGVVAILVSIAATAVEPDEMLTDSALEARARVISQDLRCVVCQNETIDESNATLAQDMRRLVRQRVLAGDTNEEVLDYMVERYGDFVLLRPRMTPQTYLLWFGPALVLIAGGFVAFKTLRRANQDAGGRVADALSAEEKAHLERLVADQASEDTR